MPSISLTNPENVTRLELGTSSETKLGGNIDLSKFTLLTWFNGDNMDLNTLAGFENLSQLQRIYAQDNLLADFDLPTLANTSISFFNISNTATGTSDDTGPSDVVDGWSVPPSLRAMYFSRTRISKNVAAKRKILTALYDVFRNAGYASNRSFLNVNWSGGAYLLDRASNLNAPHSTVTVGEAVDHLASIGFSVAGFSAPAA